MKQTTLIAVVLGVLVLTSAVQAFQLYSLKEKVKTGTINLGATTSVKTDSSSVASGAPQRTAAVPANIQNLPAMVGGC